MTSTLELSSFTQPSEAQTSTSSATILQTTLRERQNAYIHLTFTRKDFNECLRVIEEQLRATNGQSEYPLYVKGLLCFEYFYFILFSIISLL